MISRELGVDMLNLHDQGSEDTVWTEFMGEMLDINKKQEKQRKLKNKQNLKSPVLLLRIHDQKNKTDERKDSQWISKFLQALHRDQPKKGMNNKEIFMRLPQRQSTWGREN